MVGDTFRMVTVILRGSHSAPLTVVDVPIIGCLFVLRAPYVGSLKHASASMGVVTRPWAYTCRLREILTEHSVLCCTAIAYDGCTDPMHGVSLLVTGPAGTILRCKLKDKEKAPFDESRPR